jgi:hypothetical protein
VELEIVHRVIKDLLAAGYKLAVDDGETTAGGTEQELVNAVFGVDVAALKTRKLIDKYHSTHSFVSFVRGNDGHDIICDYGVSLEPVLAPVNEWVETQCELGFF